MRNAIVRLRQLPSHPSEITDNQRVQQTNEEGRFVFTNLDSGDWALSADKSGYASARYGASKYEPRGGRVSIKQNENVKDIVLRLAPQGLITGRVIDVDGEPIEGARVSAMRRIGHDAGVPRLVEAASAITLDNGEYRIPRLDDGRYLVRCIAPRFERAESTSGTEIGYGTTYYPDSPDLLKAGEIAILGGGDIGRIDLRVAPTRLFHVRGRFQPTPSQGPASITLVDASDPTRVFATFSVRPPEYQFDLSRIPPGSYIAYGRSGWDYSLSSHRVELRDRDIDDLLLGPPANEALISVTAKPAERRLNPKGISLSFRATDLDSGSVRAVDVKLRDDLKARLWTSPLGNFARFVVSITGLPERCYVASMQHGGKNVSPDTEIEYTAGAPLDIVIGVDGGTLDGTTLLQDERPVSGAVVALVSTESKIAVRSVKSTEGGAFHITAVPPGEYRLLAWDDVEHADLEDPGFVSRFLDQGAAVKLTANVAARASIRVVQLDTAR